MLPRLSTFKAMAQRCLLCYAFFCILLSINAKQEKKRKLDAMSFIFQTLFIYCLCCFGGYVSVTSYSVYSDHLCLQRSLIVITGTRMLILNDVMFSFYIYSFHSPCRVQGLALFFIYLWIICMISFVRLMDFLHMFRSARSCKRVVCPK